MSNKKTLYLTIIPSLLPITAFILDEIGIITPGKESYGTADGINLFLYAIPGIFLLFITIPNLFNQSYFEWSNKQSGWRWKLLLTTPLLVLGSVLTFTVFFPYVLPTLLVIAFGILVSISFSIKYFIKSYDGTTNPYRITLLLPALLMLACAVIFIIGVLSLRNFTM